MTLKFYTDGGYLESHPTWLIEDSPWKAKQVLSMIKKHSLEIETVCEIGCGAGEILKELHSKMTGNIEFIGYEVSPQAFTLCQSKVTDRLSFKLEDLLIETNYFDLALCLDVFEHVDDYFGFLENLRSRSKYKIFHIPLDLSISTLLRGKVIEKSWHTSGHIHFFTKEIALQSLIKSGYSITDYCYTPYYVECCSKNSVKGKLMNLPRKILYAINQDLAVRILGGYELLVLAE